MITPEPEIWLELELRNTLSIINVGNHFIQCKTGPWHGHNHPEWPLIVAANLISGHARVESKQSLSGRKPDRFNRFPPTGDDEKSNTTDVESVQIHQVEVGLEVGTIKVR